MKAPIAAPLLLALCLACAAAMAQDAKPDAPAPAPAPNTAACPADARDLPLPALYGRWEARFEGLPGVAVVQLGKHPDYPGVRGTVTRTADGTAGATTSTVAQLAGDVDDEGTLSIDESQDGHAISGVWSGKLQVRSCGREFRGTWRNATDDSTHPFVLSKTASPQGTQ